MATDLENHHGTTYGYRLGCRCDECKGAMRVYKANLKRRGPTPHTKHGTMHAYISLGCRCDKCKKVASDSAKRYQAKRQGADEDGWIVA